MKLCFCQLFPPTESYSPFTFSFSHNSFLQVQHADHYFTVQRDHVSMWVHYCLYFLLTEKVLFNLR